MIADSAVARRVAEGIERHRKGDAVVRVLDADGKAVAGVPVTVEQTHSAFLFGANIFMLDCYPSADLNEKYERMFCDLFNAATVPFYWKALEPEPGKPRFAADSPPIRRRPPPDRVVAFCEQHGLSMNGHTLVWDNILSVPEWLPDNPAESLPLWENRVREIGERYGQRIPRWDVLNEPVTIGWRQANGLSRPMPAGFERRAFTWADRYFPSSARLMINETTGAWNEHCQTYRDLIRRLRADGARIDAIGLQFHLFSDAEMRRLQSGELFPPATLLAALDAYAEFNLPVHVSEITLTAPAASPDGREAQAAAARELYRLWFSHPLVDSITWWNVPDGGQVPGEDKVASGLLDRELNPKPAYRALHDLIHREWRTQENGLTDDAGCFRFRGFHGLYTVQVNHQPGLAKLQLRPAPSATEWVIS